MIPSGVEVFVALAPVDMRSSFDRLSGVAKEQVGYEARRGALFVFYGRRRDALKILFFDGSGMCIFYKRLDRARSPCRRRWPRALSTSPSTRRPFRDFSMA